MKLRTLLATALILTAGCATKKTESAAPERQNLAPSSAEEAAPPSAPAESEPSFGAAAVCTTPECEDACAKAGELKSACAEAFAKGCMSDVKPDDYDCNWESTGPGEAAAEEEAAPEAKEKGARRRAKEEAEEPSDDETLKAQMEDEMD